MAGKGNRSKEMDGKTLILSSAFVSTANFMRSKISSQKVNKHEIYIAPYTE